VARLYGECVTCKPVSPSKCATCARAFATGVTEGVTCSRFGVKFLTQSNYSRDFELKMMEKFNSKFEN
jgi:hypothetical protein